MTDTLAVQQAAALRREAMAGWQAARNVLDARLERRKRAEAALQAANDAVAAAEAELRAAAAEVADAENISDQWRHVHHHARHALEALEALVAEEAPPAAGGGQ